MEIAALPGAVLISEGDDCLCARRQGLLVYKVLRGYGRFMNSLYIISKWADDDRAPGICLGRMGGEECIIIEEYIYVIVIIQNIAADRRFVVRSARCSVSYRFC